MKKVLSVLLAVCMLFAVLATSGCTLSTAKTIGDAIKKTEALEDIDATLFLEISMDMGFSITIPVPVNMKAKNIKSQAPTVYVDMTLPMGSMELKTSVYQEEDMLYVSENGLKYKQKIAESDGEYDCIGYVNNIIKDIPDDLLESIELVKNEDGSQSASLTIDDARFKEIFRDLVLDSADDSSTGEDDEYDMAEGVIDDIMQYISINDATVKITVKDGYVSVYEISYSMTADVESVKTTSSVKASVTYNNPGEPVEITPPEGYKDYGPFSENGFFGDLFG